MISKMHFSLALGMLAVAVLLVATSWAADTTATKDATKNCCEAKLACCKEGAACCAAPTKLGCCEKGMACCDQGKACCDVPQACCGEGQSCCEEGKACCGDTKSDSNKDADAKDAAAFPACCAKKPLSVS